MTQEEKELLLQDLCARLPYGVILNCAGDIGEKLKTIDENGLINNDWDINEVKPYLRPLSSMTEEEQKEFESIWDDGFGKALDAQISNFDDCVIRNLEITASSNAVDWLNKKMFDYRGLIPRRLAISTEEFNPYEN